jgi:hypothetical protein
MHILDDFCLQGILAKFKCKDFWIDKDKLYENDYIISLFIHGLSWTISINIPIIFIMIKYNYINNPGFTFIFIVEFLFNWIIHCIVDHFKANEKIINLITDQLIHFIQILLLFTIFVSILINN